MACVIHNRKYMAVAAFKDSPCGGTVPGTCSSWERRQTQLVGPSATGLWLPTDTPQVGSCDRWTQDSVEPERGGSLFSSRLIIVSFHQPSKVYIALLFNANLLANCASMEAKLNVLRMTHQHAEHMVKSILHMPVVECVKLFKFYMLYPGGIMLSA